MSNYSLVHNNILKISTCVFSFFFLIACEENKKSEAKLQSETALQSDYEKYTLSNGLDVILHQDASNPIVAVASIVHVGSSREKIGKTGFTHIFEHMILQKTENIPEHFGALMNKWAGRADGSTGTDITNYYEVVPSDALEKVLWLESDRMGFFINAIEESSLEAEKPIIKNEKRMRVDNIPYGFNSQVIKKALYPEGHPMSWPGIGEMEDIDNASIEDIKDFYEKYYGPNNSTIVIAGDFDKKEAKEWIDKYFGEIPSRGQAEQRVVEQIHLKESVSLYHEDQFAQLPQLTISWPTIPLDHPDALLLDMLASLLTDEISGTVYKEVVENEKLSSQINASHNTFELSGEFTISSRANENSSLEDVKKAIEKSFEDFAVQEIEETTLDRLKASYETSVYNGLTSVLNKAVQLARNNALYENPNATSEHIKTYQNITANDIKRVFNTYIKGTNNVTTSFVPVGKKHLAVTNASKATIKLDKVVKELKTTDQNNNNNISEVITKTPSKFDRTIEPPFGKSKAFKLPTINSDTLDNGLTLLNIEQHEIPIINFSIHLKGGLLLENPNKIGVANLYSKLLLEGTQKNTPDRLKERFGELGSTIFAYTSKDGITISGSCLSKNFEKTIDLVQQVLLKPRFDEDAFDKIRSSTLNQIIALSSNSYAIINNVSNRYRFGTESILSYPIIGTKESLQLITIEDIKNYHFKNNAPNLTSIQIVGDISTKKAEDIIEETFSKWVAKNVAIPEIIFPQLPNETVVFLVDIPKARQTFVSSNRTMMGNLSKDYFPFEIANYKLGIFPQGKLWDVLREEKGYTYRAYTNLYRDVQKSNWQALALLQTEVTKDGVYLFDKIISEYADTYSQELLDATKNEMQKRIGRDYESLRSLLSLLEDINSFGLPLDFVDNQQQELNTITLEEVKNVAETYLDTNKRFYIIVGDMATQEQNIKELNLGKIIHVDTQGLPLK